MKELLETGISTGLGYSGSCDALVGKVKELSVVIKENNATKSYGCLIWVKKKNSSSDDELYSYLSEQVAAKPHIIKHFKTTGRGASLALVKYNDPSRNMTNIDRFLGDLADDLYAHDYVNCCYACGGTENLGIYREGGAVVQYCAACAKGTPVTAGDAPAAEEETAPDIAENVTETAPAAEEAFGEAGSLEDILADFSVMAGEYTEETTEDSGNVIASADDTADLSDFMIDGTETAAEEQPEPVVQRAEAAEEYVPDSSLDSFMFTESEPAPEPERASSSEPAFGDANTYIEEEHEESANLDEIMHDLDNIAEEEPEEDYEAEAAENASIVSLMVGSEQELADAEAAEVTELSPIEIGRGADLQVTVQEEEDFGDFGEMKVTEIVDDSNEGEDFQIEALDSDFNMPTDTKGGEIRASETPLERDGSVPMVNPKSDFADVKPSSARDKNAVRAFAYGSYDNANTAAEPVRYDGRPIGYKGTDPRLGDEVGSVSRDYSRQNAARFAPDAKPLKKEGFRVVSKADPARMKPINTSRSYVYGSNAAVGAIAGLLFGVIGCAVWCGIGFLLGLIGMTGGPRPIIMAVLGFLPTFGAFLGYRIGGDCYDTKGIIISAILSLITDAVGLIAVFVTGEMQLKSIEYGYSIGIDKAFENVSGSLSDGSLTLQLIISLGVMAVALAAAVIISRKKS